jgi:hypothetical protein
LVPVRFVLGVEIVLVSGEASHGSFDGLLELVSRCPVEVELAAALGSDASGVDARAELADLLRKFVFDSANCVEFALVGEPVRSRRFQIHPDPEEPGLVGHGENVAESEV